MGNREKWKKNPSTVRPASGEASFFLFYIKHAQDLQGLSRAQPARAGHRHSQSAPLPCPARPFWPPSQPVIHYVRAQHGPESRSQVLPHPQLIFPSKTWFFGIYLNFQWKKSLKNQYLPHSESKSCQKRNAIKSCSLRSFQDHQTHIPIPPKFSARL